jgi:hypothetical protein
VDPSSPSLLLSLRAGSAHTSLSLSWVVSLLATARYCSLLATHYLPSSLLALSHCHTVTLLIHTAPSAHQPHLASPHSLAQPAYTTLSVPLFLLIFPLFLPAAQPLLHLTLVQDFLPRHPSLAPAPQRTKDHTFAFALAFAFAFAFAIPSFHLSHLPLNNYAIRLSASPPLRFTIYTSVSPIQPPKWLQTVLPPPSVYHPGHSRRP